MEKKSFYIGTDIVEVSKITRAINNGGDCFLHRVFSLSERKKFIAEDMDYERVSGFWAAKESLVKALGLGFREGITFQDMEVQHDCFGCPYFYLSGRIAQIIKERDIGHISLSISHCRTHAVAVTIIS